MMLLRIVLVGLAYSLTGTAGAAEATPRREIIPGATLMTHAERMHYRARLQAAKTPEERARERARHVADLQARARERGLAVLDLAAEARRPAPDRRKR